MEHLWYTKLSMYNEPEYRELLGTMPETTQARISKYKKKADQRRTLLGRRMLQLMMKNHGVGGLEQLEFGSEGKPYNKKGPPFNIAHSDDYVILGFLSQNGHNVGVDIERIQALDFKSMGKHFLCGEEMDYLSSATNEQSAFFELWTRKEALLKARGSGFMMDPKTVNCLDESETKSAQYQLQEIDIDTDYKCFFASTRKNTEVRVVRMEAERLMRVGT